MDWFAVNKLGCVVLQEDGSIGYKASGYNSVKEAVALIRNFICYFKRETKQQPWTSTRGKLGKIFDATHKVVSPFPNAHQAFFEMGFIVTMTEHKVIQI